MAFLTAVTFSSAAMFNPSYVLFLHQEEPVASFEKVSAVLQGLLFWRSVSLDGCYAGAAVLAANS